jgi:hypothetical protein
MSSLRRAIALVLIAVTGAGCSKAVVIPRDQLSGRPETRVGYRIQMVDGSHYTARRFSTTDSTLVIEKLNPSDSRHKKVTVPIVLSMNDIQSVSRLEMREGLSFAVVAFAGVIVILLMNPPELPATD